MKTIFENLYRISPASWLIAFLLDLLWAFFESPSLLGFVLVLFISPLVFFLCFPTVTLIQRYQAGETWGSAMLQASILGVVAAFPYPILLIPLGILSLIGRSQAQLTGETIQLGQLTEAWQELEEVIFTRLPVELQHPSSTEAAIDHLHAEGFITPAELAELHYLRRQRNRAVHQRVTNNLENVINRIRVMSLNLGRRSRWYR